MGCELLFFDQSQKREQSLAEDLNKTTDAGRRQPRQQTILVTTHESGRLPAPEPTAIPTITSTPAMTQVKANSRTVKESGGPVYAS